MRIINREGNMLSLFCFEYLGLNLMFRILLFKCILGVIGMSFIWELLGLKKF